MDGMFKLYFIGVAVVLRQCVYASDPCENEQQLEAAIAYCSPLNDTNGIYQPCFDDVNPLETYTDCLSDHCADPNLACATMQLYEQECVDFGETNYTSVLDACGVCHGDGSSCSLAPTVVPTTKTPTHTPTFRPTGTPTTRAPTPTPTSEAPTHAPLDSPTPTPTSEAPTHSPTDRPSTGGKVTTKLIIGFGIGGGILVLVAAGIIIKMKINKQHISAFPDEKAPFVKLSYA